MNEISAVMFDRSAAMQGTYEDMLMLADEAMNWLITNGVRVDSTRAIKLMKNVSQLRDDITSGKVRAPHLSQLWEIAELDDLIQISTQLKGIGDPRFLATLAKVTGGPHLLADEKTTGGSIQGRNATFELFAAARFARAGLPAVFKSDADATIETSMGELALECKRVAVADKLERNIRDAASQIKNRISSDGVKAGYVCISISRLVHQVAFENPENIFGNPTEFQASAREMLAVLGQHIVSRCRDLAPSVLAIGLHYKLPFVNGQTAAPTMMNRFVFYSLLDQSHARDKHAIETHVHNLLSESID